MKLEFTKTRLELSHSLYSYAIRNTDILFCFVLFYFPDSKHQKKKKKKKVSKPHKNDYLEMQNIAFLFMESSANRFIPGSLN